MNDQEKINKLKELGVWNSLYTDFIEPLHAWKTEYTCWTNDGNKLCRLSLEFQPSTVLRSQEENTKFLVTLMELVADVQARHAPDLPEKIYLLEEKKEDN